MSAVAVVGLSCRLPGAESVGQYWDNLLNGRDLITRLPTAELRGRVPDALLDDPRWVGASGCITDPYHFDPSSFTMAPSEALLTDPAHRLLMKTGHEALQDACVVPSNDRARIGVFAAVGRSRHEEIIRNVLTGRGDIVDETALEVGNEKDHSAAKVAYRLGLRGPSINVQSACSSGLLALHLAAQSLVAYECDIALVAASTLRVPGQYGYVHVPGGIGSPDGYCRAFSAAAAGTVSGDGVVAVVLKRLDDSRADCDRVLAIVRGSAVNNDGARSGYAMVTAAAQEQVIRDALLFAEVEAAQIGSVEAHGSGTPLGDAVEWTALSAVYGESPRTLVGSVKSGIGHVREAAGLAGFARMVLSVSRGRIPPTLHVGVPADFVGRAESGLALSRRNQAWPTAGPRVGAVSSFGLGGTNVHIVVEEPPPPAGRPGDDTAPPSLVLISARSAEAANRTAKAWGDAIVRGDATPSEAADVSQFGRRHLRFRRFAVSRSAEDLAGQLTTPEAVRVLTARDPSRTATCFVFPGLGDHYPQMGAGLRDSLPGFAQRLDGYLAVCSDLIGRDLRSAAAASDRGKPRSESAIDFRSLFDTSRHGRGPLADPVAAHAVMFSTQLALARTLGEHGLRPAAVTGHSLGELCAATVAGVFGDDDALRVVIERIRLVAAQPQGAMLAVAMPSADAEALTGPGVWLAAVNGPRSCVLAGTREAIDAVSRQLNREGLQGRLLPSSHAFHTPLLDTAGAQLATLLENLTLSAPSIPMIANLTGDWIGDEVTSPGYWHRQLTAPVLFGQALRTAAARCGVLVEIGPGQLRTLITQIRGGARDVCAIPTMRRAYQNEQDDVVLMRALGELWQAGVELDWAALRSQAQRWKGSLPPTAADERRMFIADGADLAAAPAPLSVPRSERHTDSSPSSAKRSGPGDRRADLADTVALQDGDDACMQMLAAVWEDVLGISDLDGDSDFFDLGGDSMMGARLLSGIAKALGTRVPAVAVFEASTLRGMARCVKAWQVKEGVVDL
ncbi:type I polyketide synthase [Streptomyces collinus]|uniref:type I polyketide synthase n=1 Tax=Streptomyces collinus TaxID=42684 RepID=UPI0036B9C248